jgi:pyrroline-5-carboxylate reductase
LAELSYFKTISVLGCGHMGGSLIRGIIASGNWDASHVRIFDSVSEVSFKLAQETGASQAKNVDELLAGSGTLVCAVKPQIFPNVVDQLLASVQDDMVLVSIMAGLSSQKINAITNGKFQVVRTMPNLPLSVSSGATAIAVDEHSEDILSGVEKLFNSVGRTVRVTSAQMDAVTGLSGSGPMYVFEFIDALITAGMESGLERDIARNLAVQTIKGSIKLIESSDETPGDWTKKVCSPGGTTLAGLDVLNNKEFKNILIQAVSAAVSRSKELGLQ